MQKYFFVMIQPKYFSNYINLFSYGIFIAIPFSFNSLATNIKS